MISIHASIHLNTWAWPKGKSSLYVDCFQCCVGHTTELCIACLVNNTEHKKKNCILNRNIGQNNKIHGICDQEASPLYSLRNDM